MATEYYVVAVVGGVYFMYLVTKYILSYPQRKLFRQQQREIEEILGGFDFPAERAKVLRLLRESLPEAYHCGRRRCNGILLKEGSYYVCSDCHNLRSTIRKSR